MHYKTVKLFAFTAALLASANIAAAQGSPSHIQDSPRRISVEAVPNISASTSRIHRVVAAKTPSGFEVPRYVSLKVGKTNGRSGPTMKHPILWQYRRAGLPVIIVAETENWRKIRDVQGDESWVYKAGLTGERNVISLADTPIYKRSDPKSDVVAIAEKQALLRLEDCKNKLCRVYTVTGIRGWVNESAVWGASPLF